MIDRIARRLRLEVLPNLIGAQGYLDMRAAGANALPYVGAVGLTNLGDEALLELARCAFTEHRLVAAKQSPFLQRLVLDRCARAAHGLLVGGGTSLLSDSLLLTLERTAPYATPFVTFGTGVLDPEFHGALDAEKQQRWRAAFAHAAAVGVRGPRSKQILDDLGVPDVRIVGDAATLCVRQSPREPASERVLGVNVGTAWGRVWGGDEQLPLATLAMVLRRFTQDGWHVRFFCVWPYDMPVVRSVAAAAQLDKPDIVEEYFSCERFMREVGTCRLFVGMKLHAIMLAVCARVPAMALEYRPKVRDFMLSIDAPSECIRFDRYDADMLTEAVRSLATAHEAVASRQGDATRKLARTFAAYVTELKALAQQWRATAHPNAKPTVHRR